MALSFISCKKDEEKLATPEGVTMSETGLITWNAVEHASEYAVTINSSVTTVTETQYQVADLTVSFTYSVTAKAEGYQDSDPSAVQSYTAPAPDVTVSISGTQNWVGSGSSITLFASVSGNTKDRSVTWSMTGKGATLTPDADNANNAVLTADAGLTGDGTVTVRATSNANSEDYAEKTITLRAKTNLTQAMLDEVGANDKIEFFGTINIDLYTIGTFGRLESTSSIDIETKMDGTYWYTNYYNSYTSSNTEMFVKNNDNIASQVSLSYMNTEQYTPMRDDNGDVISWEASGMYNSFKGLTIDQFEFNDDTWRWEFVGEDKSVAERLVSASNPYVFDVRSLSLLIAGDMIIGLEAESESDYTLQSGYRGEKTMVVTLNYNEVDMPTLSTFEYDPEIHDRLKSAIEKMQSLSSYTLNFYHEMSSPLYGETSTTGYIETVTEDVAYFRDYIGIPDDYEFTGYEYGFRKEREGLYNSFYLDEVGVEKETNKPIYDFRPGRAYEGDFSEAKPSFAFAPEIFEYYVPEGNGANRTHNYYMLDNNMMSVASVFYKGVENDDAMYAIFASPLSTSIGTIVPTVIVNNEGYIEEMLFTYNMTIMYGFIDITFSDFNTATLPTPAGGVEFKFQTREVPTDWNSRDPYNGGFDVWGFDDDGNDTEEPLFPFITENYNIEAEDLPFFNSVLGDTFGYAAETMYQYTAGRYVHAMCLYYDVPLDRDYTINSSINAASAYLRELGYESLGNHRFRKDGVIIAIVDEELDFNIYIWLDQSQSQPSESAPSENN